MNDVLQHARGLSRPTSLLLVLVVIGVFWPAASPPAEAGRSDSPARSSTDWLEPQGINIVDLVGSVPEQYLKGATITYTPGWGIVTYESGTRNGDAVTIRAHASTRYMASGSWSASMYGCLGQPARIDQLGASSPATTLRVYQGSRDVTREVDSMSYVPAGKIKPIYNPKESEGANRYRYWETAYAAPRRAPDGQIIIPANMGCEIMMSGKNYPDLTLVFTARSPKVINAGVAGQESFTFHSYLGPGYVGQLQSLVDQLHAAGYPNRAEYFNVHAPAGSNYFFLNYPAMRADMYSAYPGSRGNEGRPTTGTYRTVINSGLSVDHVVSMGLPLRGHWQDIDQADGTWLRYAQNTGQITAPEYPLAPGVPYNPCMTVGGCSGDLLSRVYNTAASMTVIYLNVSRASASLERRPVQMVGSGYHYGGAQVAEAAGIAGGTTEDQSALSEMVGSAGNETAQPDASEASAAEASLLASTDPTGVESNGHRILLPGISFQLTRDDPTGCSPNGGCGWFTADGRMVAYIPNW